MVYLETIFLAPLSIFIIIYMISCQIIIIVLLDLRCFFQHRDSPENNSDIPFAFTAENLKVLLAIY